MTTLTGSIGVILSSWNIGLMDKVGVRVHLRWQVQGHVERFAQPEKFRYERDMVQGLR